MSRGEADAFDLFSLPARATPAVLIAAASFFLDWHFKLHNAVSIIIFASISIAVYNFVPKKFLFGLGLIISTAVALLIALRITHDLTWAVFWGGLYLAVGWYSLRAFLQQSHAEPADDEEEEAEDYGAQEQSLRPTKKDRSHKKVGFCQGWNVSPTSRSSHYLYRCGSCGTAGCDDANCDKANFRHTSCLSCGVRGSGFSQ